MLLQHVKVVLGSSIRPFEVEQWGQWDQRHPCQGQDILKDDWGHAISGWQWESKDQARDHGSQSQEVHCLSGRSHGAVAGDSPGRGNWTQGGV